MKTNRCRLISVNVQYATFLSKTSGKGSLACMALPGGRGLANNEKEWAGEVPRHFQSTIEAPSSKVINPQMFKVLLWDTFLIPPL